MKKTFSALLETKYLMLLTTVFFEQFTLLLVGCNAVFFVWSVSSVNCCLGLPGVL